MKQKHLASLTTKETGINILYIFIPLIFAPHLFSRIWTERKIKGREKDLLSRTLMREK